MFVKNFPQAEKFLFSSIPKASDRFFPGEFGLERQKYLLGLLGNPQEKLRIVHIAGTSGKGSTAYLTSLILKSLGFKTGLHLSPHLVDVRERVQLNNKFLAKEKFVGYLKDLLPAIEKVAKSHFGPATYFEILVALAYWSFCKEKVDYAVMETGLGGLLDGTNVVKNRNKLCVFTKIGLDHQHPLGRTLAAIALQKAGIIQAGNTVVSVKQRPVVRKQIERVAKKKGANAPVYASDRSKIGFYGLVMPNLPGEHQLENLSVALEAVRCLASRDKFGLNWRKIKHALRRAYFSGRFDIKRIRGKTIVLDGAHNPDKMRAFVKTLQSVFPEQKLVFLVAFKKGKNWRKMLRIIIPFSRKIVITNFFSATQDWVHLSEDPQKVAAFLTSLNFRRFEISRGAKNAFRKVLRNSPSPIAITGSLYLLSEIYKGNFI